MAPTDLIGVHPVISKAALLTNVRGHKVLMKRMSNDVRIEPNARAFDYANAFRD